MSAYALMRNSRDLEAGWLRSPLYKTNKDICDALRQALGLGDASQYRGIGRFPFTEYDEGLPGWQWHRQTTACDPESRARGALLEAFGPYDYVTSWPRAFLASLEATLAVKAVLRTPDAYEIVELGKSGEELNQPVGYDVGYWGGGNFSILCDAMIWPTWHPPTREAWAELARFSRNLNSALLFPSEPDAEDYLKWYGAQEWAETDPEHFQIIGIGAIE